MQVTSLVQLFHFGNKTLLQHMLEAQGNPFVQQLALLSFKARALGDANDG